MSKQLIKWITFSVLLTILPLVANYLFHLITQNPITFQKLISHGELLLLAVASVGNALGEVMAGAKRQGAWMLCGKSGCILIIVMASMLFAYVSGATLAKGSVDISVVRTVSVVVYLCAFLTGGFCIMCNEA